MTHPLFWYTRANFIAVGPSQALRFMEIQSAEVRCAVELVKRNPGSALNPPERRIYDVARACAHWAFASDCTLRDEEDDGGTP